MKKANYGKHDQKKVLAIKKLAIEFNYTEVYIRQCLRGDSAALVADDIKKRYGVIYQQLEKALA
jgi:hypothetical protein